MLPSGPYGASHKLGRPASQRRFNPIGVDANLWLWLPNTFVPGGKKMARKEKPFIPQKTEDITAEYLTTALADLSGGATVTHVSWAPIGVGIGFVGDLFRGTLTWDNANDWCPDSVVAKVPSSVKANRGVGEGLMAYEREIVMYREAVDDLSLPMPEHYHSAFEPNPTPWMLGVLEWVFDHLPLRGINWLVNKLVNLPESAMRDYLLIIEDIADARPAEQFDGGNLEDARVSLELLAKFHADAWMNQDLLDKQPLLWSVGRSPKVFQAGYVRNRDQFVETFGDLLDPTVIDHIDKVHEEVPALTNQVASAPWTILHGDYRLDNILFRSDGSLVVLDYQLVMYGRAGWDVAYFITTALSPEHRAEEDALLHTYHDALLSHGITDYSFDELVADTTTTKELLAHRMVGSGDMLDTDVEGREQSFIELMVGRVAGWVDV